MKLNKVSSIFLLLGGALVVGSLVVSCSHKAKSSVSAPKREQGLPSSDQPKGTDDSKQALQLMQQYGPVSIDFDNAPLTDITLFMTNKTGKSFILNGMESKTISWTGFNIPRDKLLDAFCQALAAHNLILKASASDQTVFTIEKAEEEKVPYKLNFLTCSNGVFFLFDGAVISKDKFQYPLKHENGQWFAIIPKSLAQRFDQADSAPAKVATK